MTTKLVQNLFCDVVSTQRKSSSASVSQLFAPVGDWGKRFCVVIVEKNWKNEKNRKKFERSLEKSKKLLEKIEKNEKKIGKKLKKNIKKFF